MAKRTFEDFHFFLVRSPVPCLVYATLHGVGVVAFMDSKWYREMEKAVKDFHSEMILINLRAALKPLVLNFGGGSVMLKIESVVQISQPHTVKAQVLGKSSYTVAKTLLVIFFFE